MQHLFGFAGAKVVKMYETTKCLGDFFSKNVSGYRILVSGFRIQDSSLNRSFPLFAQEVAGEIVVELLLVEIAEGQVGVGIEDDAVLVDLLYLL